MDPRHQTIAASARSPTMRVGTSSSYRLVLLGLFELTFEGRQILLPRGSQPLVAYLALTDRPATRQHVAADLWPTAGEERSTANLRSALWRLRRAGADVVEAHDDALGLTDALSVDVREFAAVARAVVDRPTSVDRAGLSMLVEAHDLLPDWSDEWLVVERERIRQLRLHALERVCEDLTKRGFFGQAVEAGLAAVAGEPFRESAHRVLIKAYLGEGNHHEALDHFRRHRRTLREELGVEPSPELADLVRNLPRRN